MYRIKTGGIFVLVFIFLLLYACLIFLKQYSLHQIPKPLQKYLMYEKLHENETMDIKSLKITIKDINMRHELRNWEKFGHPLKETTTIVVQIHKDIIGLQHLIISLAQVRFIDSVLLIFSHSYYNEHINRLIHSIDFCKVMQIFYPHSIQLHPHKFPETLCEGCSNKIQLIHDYPQQDASSTEHKQHWWWKANFIFKQMPWSSSYTGTVIFLEEDQYVAPDLLHMLQYAKRSLSYFPDVEIMSFGKMYARNLDPHLLTLDYWRPPFDVGLAFNKSTWNNIETLSSFYCMYDDSSWSYSLLNVFKNFPAGDVDMVACVAPRVISAVQFKTADQGFLELSREFSKLQLFPENVKAIFLFGPNGRVRVNAKAPPRGNGGWGNINDHLLCLDTLSAASEFDKTNTTSRFDYCTG